MGVRFLGIGREAARSKARKKKFGAERENAMTALNEIMGSLKGGVDDARNRAQLSATDLYGESITRNTDNIRANANNTKSALARGAAATGGDVTGSRGVAFDRVDQNANEGIGKIERFYEDRAKTDNEQSRSRGDRLMNVLLGANSNLLNFANANYQNEISRDLQRKQANKQLGMDFITAGIKAATTAATGGAGAAAG